MTKTNYQLFLLLLIQVIIFSSSGCVSVEDLDGDVDGDEEITLTGSCDELCLKTCQKIQQCEVNVYTGEIKTCDDACDYSAMKDSVVAVKYYGCYIHEDCKKFSDCILTGGVSDFTCKWDGQNDGDVDEETAEDDSETADGDLIDGDEIEQTTDGDVDGDEETDSAEDGDLDFESEANETEMDSETTDGDLDTVDGDASELDTTEEEEIVGVSCNNPIPLNLGLSSINYTTMNAVNHYTSTCGESKGEDVVYTFTLEVPLYVEFHVYGFDTVLYLRSTCDDSETEIACNDDIPDKNKSKSLDSRISATLASGTYYLFVDGYAASDNFTLEITTSCGSGLVFDTQSGNCVDDPCLPNLCDGENQTVCVPDLPGYECLCDPGFMLENGVCVVDENPTGNSCDDPIPLDISVAGSVSGTTMGASSNYNGTCSEEQAEERVYAFHLDAKHKYTLKMNGFDTLMYLRTTCDNSSTEVACNDDDFQYNAGLSGTLDSGTYYVFADGYEDAGNYTLVYDFIRDPCANGPCSGVLECVPSSNWKDYTCVCPEGYLPYDGNCVDDPCEPNNCTEAHKTKCEPDLPGNYVCQCEFGYVDDGEGGCEIDPDANEWTFMVFLNADNNLEDDGYSDVEEMQEGGSNVYVNIVSLFDTYSGDANYIYIEEGKYSVVENLGEVDMSDYQVLADFGKWAIENYPARHYALVLWDHGDGWTKKSSFNSSYLVKGFSNDDHGAKGEISIARGDYANAMQQISNALGQKLDLVGFDACLMGMWEVAEASAPYADYLVASSETEPVWGWDYTGFIPLLVNNPTETSALDLAKNIVDSYYSYNTDNATLAVSNLGTMNALATDVTNLANSLMNHSDLYGEIETIRSNTQNFYHINEFRDLYHFAKLLTEWDSVPSDIETAAQNLMDQLDVTVAYSKAQSSHPNSYGLAIYFPQKGSSFNELYRDEGAVWSTRTTWDEFVEDFTDASK